MLDVVSIKMKNTICAILHPGKDSERYHSIVIKAISSLEDYKTQKKEMCWDLSTVFSLEKYTPQALRQGNILSLQHISFIFLSQKEPHSVSCFNVHTFFQYLTLKLG